MHIDWVIACRFVEVHDNLATMIGAGIDRLEVPQLPSNIAVMIALRLTGVADEFDESIAHTFRNVVRDPDGAVVGDSGADGEMRVDAQGTREDWLAGIVLAAAVHFAAAKEGTYTIDFFVDDQQSSIPMHIDLEGLSK